MSEITNETAETAPEAISETAETAPEVINNTTDAAPDKMDILIGLQKKNLLYAGIRTGFLAGIVLLLLIVSIVLIAKAGEISRTLADVQTAMQTVRDKADSIDTEQLNSTVVSLQEAADNLSNFNIDDFNASVVAFEEAVEKFKQLDITNINGLVESLKTVSDRLESVTSAFSSLFGR